ncbi:peptidase inhibitor family I36 protein [Streptomyces olivochromogenes]|uniref:peptidase inhibitor family I36 protein n=1 Tax=Streptomyces olivochromogenes TaxID=1963 RepID=UPI001F23A4D1|nr:peptidase inhibitor family I36 protein [Streptomyces olivochromogenes]MCF3134756.1 peptidase inhibitor family I36 protein [Streptomyces olivochromogenes]
MYLGRFLRIVMTMGAALIVASAMATTPASAVPPTPATSSASNSPMGKSSLLNRQARSDAELREQIALQLKIAPGGKQTSRNEVSYGNGKFVVTYALPGPRAIAGDADCPSGWFCFYQDINWGYPRGKLQDCGTQDLGAWGWKDRTSSVDNSTDSAVFYSSLGGEVLIRNWARRAIAWVGANANDRAEYVDHQC